MRFIRPHLNPLLAMFFYGALTGAFVTLLVTTRILTPSRAENQGTVKGVSVQQETAESQGQTTRQPPSEIATLSPPNQDAVAEAVVKRVIDGDTMELESGLRVRAIGINSPEMDVRGIEGCLAAAALEAHRNLAQGKTVELERDVSDKDRYGRLLRYVWIDNVLLNIMMVEQGLARAVAYPPDVKYQQDLAAAEERAKNAQRGMWGSVCRTAASGESTDTSTHLPALPSVSECTIKGNISSNGDKIFHLPGCRSYAKAIITPSTDERWFCTEEEALSAGWRKAGDCPKK
ncbi:MAG: thermonuclease family protein [Patescibacteria group bacterium]